MMAAIRRSTRALRASCVTAFFYVVACKQYYRTAETLVISSSIGGRPQAGFRATSPLQHEDRRFHFPGMTWYGHTKQGKYMCKPKADHEGDRPTQNGQ